SVSETLGHQCGEELIAGLAPRIQKELTEDDYLGRLAGDEFGVVLAGASASDGSRALAQRLLKAIAAPCSVGGLMITATADIRGASSPEQGTVPGTLLRRADSALTSAKGGQPGLAINVPQDDERGISRPALAGQLRRGIEAGQLVARYQPKVALPDGAPHA